MRDARKGIKIGKQQIINKNRETTTVAIELPNKESIKIHGKKENHKYFRILGAEINRNERKNPKEVKE